MHSHPTPPPIATLHHSPAMSTSSLASSSISPSPPVSILRSALAPLTYVCATQLSHPSTPYYQHAQAVPANSGVSYPYNPNPPLGARYGSDALNHSAHHSGSPYTSASHMVPGQVSTRSIRPSFIPSQPYPGQPMHVIHTDDAATKLSDRVRRKCYNCRTTDTSTWRRSSLTPGKVVCAYSLTRVSPDADSLISSATSVACSNARIRGPARSNSLTKEARLSRRHSSLRGLPLRRPDFLLSRRICMPCLPITIAIRLSLLSCRG